MTINLPIAGQNVTNGGILDAFPAPDVPFIRNFSNGFNYGFS